MDMVGPDKTRFFFFFLKVLGVCFRDNKLESSIRHGEVLEVSLFCCLCSHEHVTSACPKVASELEARHCDGVLL
jgi:hypothetical protein